MIRIPTRKKHLVIFIIHQARLHTINQEANKNVYIYIHIYIYIYIYVYIYIYIFIFSYIYTYIYIYIYMYIYFCIYLCMFDIYTRSGVRAAPPPPRYGGAGGRGEALPALELLGRVGFKDPNPSSPKPKPCVRTLERQSPKPAALNPNSDKPLHSNVEYFDHATNNPNF